MSLFENIKDRYIKDLKVGLKVDWCYKLLSAAKKTKRDGGLYLALELMDKTGRIPAKVWDDAETSFKMLEEGRVYRFSGYVNEFMNQKEIKVDSIKPIGPQDKDFNEADFVEKAGFDTDALFAETMGLLKANIESKHLLRLVELFAEEYGETFKTHYGAQRVHHAYLGGLLHHTHSMIRLALAIAQHYDLDREVLLVGTLFHDVGKIFEFTVTPAVDLTMAGGLVGHIFISNRIFLELTDKIEGFPEEISLKIQHLVISHHGEKEFGAPEVPKTAEAFALHLIDLLDSKLGIIKEALKNPDNKGIFTDYLRPLGRRLYIDNENDR